MDKEVKKVLLNQAAAIKDLHKRISILEGERTTLNPPPESAPERWRVTYKDDKSVTLYSEEKDVGCVINKSVYDHTNLDEGMAYSNLVIPENVNINKPVTMTCFVHSLNVGYTDDCGEHINPHLYVEWEGEPANLFFQGIINGEEILKESEAIIKRKGLKQDSKYMCYYLRENLTLKVLPYYVKKAGWRINE